MRRDSRTGRFVGKGHHTKGKKHHHKRRNPVFAAPLLAKAAIAGGAKLKAVGLGAGRAARVLIVR